jgi:hypothetical protein
MPIRFVVIALLIVMLGPAYADPNACSAVSADREYLLSIINERDRLYDAKFRASETAIALAKQATDEHFVTVQTYLTQLVNQTALYVPRTENDSKWADILRTVSANDNRHSADEKSLEAKIASIDLRITQFAGRGEGISGAWSIVIAIASLLIAAVAVASSLLVHRAPRARG